MKNKIFTKPKQAKNLFNRRVTLGFTLMVIIFAIILSRLFYLQIIHTNNYSTLSKKNSLKTQQIIAPRGKIFDRFGEVIASDNSIYQISYQENNKIIYEELDDYDILTDYTNQSYDLKNFKLKELSKRQYTHPISMAHVTGITDKENLGQVGVEKYYEQILQGKMGSKTIETDAHGRYIRDVKTYPSIAGKDINLTISVKLQDLSEKLLQNKKGAIVAIVPQSGEILALYSAPSFNSNQFTTNIKEYSKDKNKPLFNRAIAGLYPPASTIKPFIALGALDAGIISKDTKIYDPGYFQLNTDEHVYRDWKENGHGWVDLNLALTQSCDTFFYQLSHDLGIDKINKLLNHFGFGDMSNVDLIGEEKGVVPSNKWKLKNIGKPWYGGETLLTGIGQGYFLTTPIQLAQAIAIIASNGERYTPHLIKENKDKYKLKAIKLKNPNNWQIIKNAMLNVVYDWRGTASYLTRDLKYKMAGKTGTAQVISVKADEKYKDLDLLDEEKDHSLFIGFAPYDNPKIAIAVVIENEKGAPRVAKTIIEEYLNHDTE